MKIRTNIADEEVSTRERLIDVAGRLFADKGFDQTTIREICDAANANVAAVNYHFGGKIRLYEQVIIYTIKKLNEKFKVDKCLEMSATPENRLFEFVRIFLYRHFNPERPEWFGKLISKEMLNPRPSIISRIKDIFAKDKALLASIIKELLGPDATEQQVQFCQGSLLAQCLFFNIINDPDVPPIITDIIDIDEKGIEELAQHITEFSLAGIMKIRNN